MSIERGPADTYEIHWTSGHVETIQAHQVLMPQGVAIFGPSEKNPRWKFHGEINGRWTLLLTAADGDIRSVRNVSRTNDVPAGEKP